MKRKPIKFTVSAMGITDVTRTVDAPALPQRVRADLEALKKDVERRRDSELKAAGWKLDDVECKFTTYVSTENPCSPDLEPGLFVVCDVVMSRKSKTV